ncbi:MAG TPA: DUF4178 domain-containing protein [Chloroflexota bacterium]|nr:DUF4178 domain-containing protein [Chloroflexota bacterium]
MARRAGDSAGGTRDRGAAVAAMGTGRAWALGLMGLGIVIGGLLVLWTITNAATGQLRAGGVVFALILVAVLALPPLAAGYYLLRRSAVEEREGGRFEARRKLLEGDRLFRQQAAADLRGLAARLSGQAALAARLGALAAMVEGTRRDETAWYEADPLADADLPTLRRYEDTLQAETDRISDLAVRALRGEAGAAEALQASADRWERTYRQREALLLRGRRGPAVAPEALLRAGTPTRGTAALNALALGDAVTVDFEDYLVQGVLSYFAEGRTWHLYLLRSGSAERWLWGSPGGLTWAVLDPLATPPPAGAPSVESDGATLALAESGSATVDLTTAAGAEQGVSVDYWRYSGPDRRMVWVERWPREVRAGAGRETLPDTIDVWPRAGADQAP